MSTPAVGSSGSSTGTSNSTSSTTDPYSQLTTKDFINMLVAELQYQDPTNPVSNTEILQEVGQIDQIQSNTSLNSTLQSVSLGQNLATAGSLMYQNITGTDENGNSVSGQVSSVSIANGVAKLNVGNSVVDLSSITGIEAASSTTSTGG